MEFVISSPIKYIKIIPLTKGVYATLPAWGRILDASQNETTEAFYDGLPCIVGR
jgi:hypothetical protein